MSSGFTGESEGHPGYLLPCRVVTDDSTRVAGVQTGQYDIAEEMPQEIPGASGDSSLKFYVKTAGTINCSLIPQRNHDQ